MLAKLLNPPSVVKAESRMTQLHAVEKASPWAAKFGWFNHGRCQKAMALRGMKDNVRAVASPTLPILPCVAQPKICFVVCTVIEHILIKCSFDFLFAFFFERALFE
jgi:hypothetical protein